MTNDIEVPDELRDAFPLVRWVYRQEWGTVGGPFHIVLDDGNVKDAHVLFCADEIGPFADAKGLNMQERMHLHDLGRELLGLSETERWDLYAMYDDYYRG